MGKLKFLNYFGKPYKSWLPKNLNKEIRKLDSIEIDIVSHCNLNCKGCTHFSPIADKWYIEVDDFKADLKRTSELIPEDKLGCLYILGGEPLLHPQIVDILKISRKMYKKIPIIIITNGFLLGKMNDEFWNVCYTNKIEVEITKYPVKFNYNIILELKKQMKGRVKISFKGRTKIFKKKQYKLPLDCEGRQDGVYGFRNCFMAGHCINLSNGHLYTCSYVACISRFNKFFCKDIPVSEADGVDIYTCNSTKEAIYKLTTPIPFCKYCNVKERTYGNMWEISKREIKEWI